MVSIRAVEGNEDGCMFCLCADAAMVCRLHMKWDDKRVHSHPDQEVALVIVCPLVGSLFLLNRIHTWSGASILLLNHSTCTHAPAHMTAPTTLLLPHLRLLYPHPDHDLAVVLVRPHVGELDQLSNQSTCTYAPAHINEPTTFLLPPFRLLSPHPDHDLAVVLVRPLVGELVLLHPQVEGDLVGRLVDLDAIPQRHVRPAKQVRSHEILVLHLNDSREKKGGGRERA